MRIYMPLREDSFMECASDGHRFLHMAQFLPPRKPDHCLPNHVRPGAPGSRPWRVQHSPKRRSKEYIAEFLQSYGKLGYIEPKGAFYVFIDISATGLSGADFCEQFLLATGVTFSPGTVFGSQWKDYIRVSYASSMDNIREAMTSLKAFCDKMIK